MVFNRGNFATKHKINLSELAPYALHLAMVLAVAVYVVVGAIAIRHIEATPKLMPTNENASTVVRLRREDYWMRRTPMNRTRRCVIAALHRIATHTNCSLESIIDGYGIHFLDQCYNSDVQQKVEQHELRHRHEKEQQLLNQPSKKLDKTSQERVSDNEYDYWTLMDSILFCFTVITTIGYGNVAPKTFYGRIFVIFYGLIGVPFTMLAIANLGKFLASLLKAWTKPFIDFARNCHRRHRRRDYTSKEKQRLMDKNFTQKKRKNPEANPADSDSEDEEQPEEEEEQMASADALVLFVAFIIYIVVGSFVISAYEPQMDFFLAIYFNFVTLTTIGLGDLVPQSETYLVFTLIYCAVGLALTTIAIEIAADYLKKLHYFGRKLDNVGNVKIWFGGQQLTMKQLVKNLGDQFNVDVSELENLNLENFVDNAMKVQSGELATLRTSDLPYMHTDYWRAIQGNLVYVDEEPSTFSEMLTDTNRNFSLA